MDILEEYNESGNNNKYERVIIQDIHNGKQGFIYTYTNEQVKEIELIKRGSWKTYNQWRENTSVQE
ncbi:MAG: hypothetical protein ACI35P_18705 [Bacillus sp. (in: firmicutes)]